MLDAYLISVVIGILGFFLLILGQLVGWMWLIIYILKDKKLNKKFNIKKWLIVTFGGVLFMLPVVTILVFLFLVNGLWMDPVTNFNLPILNNKTVLDISKYGKDCVIAKTCGGLTLIDCKSAVDGPRYFEETSTGITLAICTEGTMGSEKQKCDELDAKIQTCK